MKDERGYLLFINSISCSLTRFRSNFPNVYWKVKLFLGTSFELFLNKIYLEDNLTVRNVNCITHDNSVIWN